MAEGLMNADMRFGGAKNSSAWLKGEEVWRQMWVERSRGWGSCQARCPSQEWEFRWDRLGKFPLPHKRSLVFHKLLAKSLLEEPSQPGWASPRCRLQAPLHEAGIRNFGKTQTLRGREKERKRKSGEEKGRGREKWRYRDAPKAVETASNRSNGARQDSQLNPLPMNASLTPSQLYVLKSVNVFWKSAWRHDISISGSCFLLSLLLTTASRFAHPDP